MSEKQVIALLIIVLAVVSLLGGFLIGHWRGKCSTKPEKGTYIGTIGVYKNDMKILEWHLREGDTEIDFPGNPHRMTFEPM